MNLRSMTILTSAMVLALTTTAFSNSKTVCAGIVAPNNMRIPVGDHSHRGLINNGGLTEDQYNAIMDRMQTLFTDQVKAKGGTYVINRMWTDDEVNSSADQKGTTWEINMYGGWARHPDTTIEGEAMVACHETGHHLGGAPKSTQYMSEWASVEGEADYFATLKCLKQFFALDDNASILAGKTIDPTAKAECMSQYTSQTDQNICMRISLAIQSITAVFADLSGDKTASQFNTPDPSQVSETNEDHPETQCRLDTYFQGSLCTVAVSAAMSDTDFKAGACVQGTDAMGFRPRCWFNPDTPSGGGSGGGGGLPIPGGGGGTGGGSTGCPLGDPSICQQLCQMEPTLPFCTQ